MPYYPEAKSGDMLLDAVFGGVFPLVRGPVRALDGSIVMDDGDILGFEDFEDMPVFFTEAINYMYLRWCNKCGIPPYPDESAP
jgi:hypothetical protein